MAKMVLGKIVTVNVLWIGEVLSCFYRWFNVNTVLNTVTDWSFLPAVQSARKPHILHFDQWIILFVIWLGLAVKTLCCCSEQCSQSALLA